MRIMKFSSSACSLVILCAWLAISGCGGSSEPDPGCRLNPDGTLTACNIEIDVPDLTLPGGIWRGIDSSGRPLLALITVLGKFQFVDGAGNQGAGFLNVAENNVVDSSFQLVPQENMTFADGTIGAECTFTGTIIERQSLSLNQYCTTSDGSQIEESIELTYDSLYERAASLEIISGMYETATGSILEIGSDGAFFSQEADSGCVSNGQVNATLSNANMYLIEYDIDGCVEPYAIWNGSSFDGLAFIDDSISPQMIQYAVTGEVDGIGVSVISGGQRI